MPRSYGDAPTPRQRQVLEWLCRREASGMIPPTLREIGSQFRMTSTNVVNDHLRALQRKGFITRNEMLSRGLRVTAKAWSECKMDIDGARADIRARMLEDIYNAACGFVYSIGVCKGAHGIKAASGNRARLENAVDALQRFETGERVA